MTQALPAKGVDLGALSLRHKERGLVIGGVDTGKSTLADMLGADFDQRYGHLKSRRLILDSKPRYRAQWTVHGVSAAKRYKGWDHGAPIVNSVVVDRPEDMELAWKSGARVVIVQGHGASHIPRLIAHAREFLKTSKASRPQLFQCDETLDFYHSNGAPRGGDDTITQMARAGRERGTACLYCSQRTKGLSQSLVEEMSKGYVLRVDAVKDLKVLNEMGMPKFEPVTEPHVFRYWTKRDYGKVYGPYRLNLKA